MRSDFLRKLIGHWTGRQDRRPRMRSRRRVHNRLGLLDSLESRVLLSGFGPAPIADVQADPMAGSGYVARDRFAWSVSPGGSAEVSVFVRDDAAHPFSIEQRLRIDNAIDELNRGWDAARGVGVRLVPAAVDSLAHIVVSQDSGSGCGSKGQGVLGCAEYFVYAAPSGRFANGDELHPFAGPEVGLHAQVTLIAGWNWYSGAEPDQITTEQFDFTTVVTHELAHAVGLEHDLDATRVDSTTQEPLNGDGESALAPTLAPGETHRKLSDQDVADLQFLYASEASAEVATATDSTASESGSDEPTGDPSGPPDDDCDDSSPDASQNEGAEGDPQDDDCDTEGDHDGMEGEGGAGPQQPELVFIEPSRANAPPVTSKITTVAAFGIDESVREQRTASRPVSTAAALISETEPSLRGAARRRVSDGNAEFAAVVSAALPRNEILASGLAATEPRFKAPAVVTTSSHIPADANRTLISQVFNALFADGTWRGRAAMTTGVSAPHRAEAAPAIDAAGLGLTALLIGGLWGAQATEHKQPKWQFLLDHMLDRSN